MEKNNWDKRCINLLEEIGNSGKYDDIIKAKDLIHEFAIESRKIPLFNTKHSKDITVFSSKSALGHMLAGSSPVDVILGIQMLNHGIIPATYGSEHPDDDILFNIVTGKPVQIRPMRILINSQSYEGQCASLVLEKSRYD